MTGRLILAYPPEGMPSPFGTDERPGDVLTIDNEKCLDWGAFCLGPDWSDYRAVEECLRENVTHEDTLVPLTEEVVLPCWKIIREKNCGGYRHAMRCTNRRRQRTILDHGGWSPNWWADVTSVAGPVVVKAPASTMGEGVEVLESGGCITDAANLVCHKNESLRRLQHYATTHLGYGYIVEEFIEGAQYEVSGAHFGNDYVIGDALLQIWEGGKIVDYIPTPNLEIEAVARATAKLFGFQDVCWCIEIKGKRGAWKVIEVHCRMGEDDPAKDYYLHTLPVLEAMVKGWARK